MKKLLISTLMLLSSCSVTPKIIQDERVPCKAEQQLAQANGSNLGWLLWYVTMGGIVIYWSLKEIKKENKNERRDGTS